ncbi:MAG: HAD hydrolase-like protein [Gemmatimonadota bacterium]
MSAHTGWIHTARRVVPQFFKLSRLTGATWRVETVAEIDPDELAERGIGAVLWDVDGTLMAHHARDLDPLVRDRFDDLTSDARFRHAIVSNCQLPRLRELGEMFPRMPVVLGFTTPDGPAFRAMEGGEEVQFGPGAGRLPPPGSNDVGEGVIPMRKPAGELIDAALERIGLAGQIDRAVMVGDQYFTDVVSANLAGARSIKVRTIDPPSFPAAIRLSQKFETAWVGLMRALGLTGRSG